LRLAPKLILALTLPICAVIAVHAMWSIDAVVARMHRSAATDLHLRGRTLALAVEAMLERGDEAAARRLVDAVSAEYGQSGPTTWCRWCPSTPGRRCPGTSCCRCPRRRRGTRSATSWCTRR
jgi:hypothetical protein